MVKVALVRVYETSVSIGYDDGYETFRSFDGLECKEVSEDELRDLRDGVKLFNQRAARNGYSLALIAQATEADAINCFDALKKYQEAQARADKQAAEAREAARVREAARREKSALTRAAKKLGVTVDELVALQAASAAKSK